LGCMTHITLTGCQAFRYGAKSHGYNYRPNWFIVQNNQSFSDMETFRAASFFL
jgi:hypothetical protein